MLGQATASVESFPRCWLRKWFGILDIHTRQKWIVLQPHLEKLPCRGIRVLDVGCGNGQWVFELAIRHPEWEITGIDKNIKAVQRALTIKDRLSIDNVSFIAEDFLTYQPPGPFDVVLSVASAHYPAEDGQGEALFERFHTWLCPEGSLFMLCPRKRDEVPFVPWLPFPAWHNMFSREDLNGLCEESGLNIVSLHGSIGRCGVIAKQIDWLSGKKYFITYPLSRLLSVLDGRRYSSLNNGPSLAWVLVARR